MDAKAIIEIGMLCPVCWGKAEWDGKKGEWVCSNSGFEFRIPYEEEEELGWDLYRECRFCSYPMEYQAKTRKYYCKYCNQYEISDLYLSINRK